MTFHHGKRVLAVLASIVCGALTLAVLPSPPAQADEVFGQQRTQRFEALPSSVSEQQRRVQEQRWPDVQPTGFFLPAGAALTVDLDLPAGAPPVGLQVGTWDMLDPDKPDRKLVASDPPVYDLKPGKTTVSDSHGGLVYVRYVKDRLDAQAPPITVTLGDAAVPVPYYVHGTTTHARWLAMLAAAKVPYAQLVGKRVMLSLSLETARGKKDADQDALLGNYDRITDMEEAIGGFDGSSQAQQRSPLRQLIAEVPTTEQNRYATWYRIGFPRGYDTAELLTPDGLWNKGWGLWHEMGHQRQQDWTWDGQGEVTVNIFALAVLRANPQAPRTGDVHGIPPEWDEAWQWLKRPAADRNFNCEASGVGAEDPKCPYSMNFNRLVMFEQLRVAFGDGFMRRLHQFTRREQPQLADSPAKQRYFMKTACKAAGQDLTGFYTTWGLSPNDGCAGLALPKPAGDLSTIATYGAGRRLTTQAKPESGGTVQPDTPGGRYGQDAKVTVTAKPSAGKTVKRWLLDGAKVGTGPTYQVTMDTDHSLVAEFGEFGESAGATEAFTGDRTRPGLWDAPLVGSGQACLTAATPPAAGSVPACAGGPLDKAGAGAVRLTGAATNQVGSLVLNQRIDATKPLRVKFDMFQYGASGGGDGMSVFLVDGAQQKVEPTQVGGWLGYKGLKGAVAGIGFDRFGNFSNKRFWSSGQDRLPNHVAVRAGEGTDYRYVSGSPALAGLGVTGTTRDKAKRTVTMNLSGAGVLSVAVDFHDGTGDRAVINDLDLTAVPGQGKLPPTLKLGFAGATGGAAATHEIQNLAATYTKAQ